MEAGQDAIHEAGEGGRCVAQTKGDLVKFEQLSTARTKRGLSLVLFCDRHLPIPTFEVQSREPLSPMESVTLPLQESRLLWLHDQHPR